MRSPLEEHGCRHAAVEALKIGFGGVAQQVLACWYHISRNTVAKLLARTGYRCRSLRKALISDDVDPHERDRQFRLIATLRRQARARGVPVLCVDTRKKEKLGHLPRRGSCYSTDVQFVYDHDYRHLATGVLVLTGGTYIPS